MNSVSVNRESLALVLIVLAMSAGTWLMLVQPKVQAATRLERELDDAAAEDETTSEVGIEALAERMAAYRARIAEVQHRSAIAEDASALYAAIMHRASDCHVIVQSMQPSASRELSKDSPVRVGRIEMTLEGSYENISRFIDSVSDLEAFIRPSSLTLIPFDADEPEQVTARFGCDVLSFEIASSLLPPGGSTDA